MTDRAHNDCDRSSAHGAISTAGIIRRILGSLQKPDLAAAAQVCHTWMDPALDALWEELDSVNPIMRLLGPISLQSAGYDWDHGFPRGDPARFASYCKRIKSLSYDVGDEIRDDVTDASQDPDNNQPLRRMRPQVPAKLLCYIAANHGKYLLPEIRTLRWCCNNWFQLHMVVPFISPTIKEIVIHYYHDVFNDMDRERLFQALRAVIPPSLRVLHFVVRDIEGHDAHEEMAAALEGKDELQELRLPFYPLIPSMFKPHIRVLEANFSFKSNIIIGDLLSQLADTCSFLEHLRITFEEGDIMDFQLIRPLLRCAKLRTLDLDYQKMLDFSSKDIQEMGNAWREMEMLHITSRHSVSYTFGSGGLMNPKPTAVGAGTPIGSLVTFAESFSSKLRKLYLHLDTRFIPTPPISPTIFPNLEVLHVGTSGLSGEQEDVAKAFAFLSAILPPAIKIGGCWSGWGMGESVFDTPLTPPTAAYKPGWLALSRMLSEHASGTTLPGESDTPPVSTLISVDTLPAKSDSLGESNESSKRIQVIPSSIPPFLHTVPDTTKPPQAPPSSWKPQLLPYLSSLEVTKGPIFERQAKAMTVGFAVRFICVE
ncbi:hypothetical protein FRC00_000688 [Tulasnella sp. 408]|nr:hypothetical protein FRC00_000688 [Tulasnella sp. 408]